MAFGKSISKLFIFGLTLFVGGLLIRLLKETLIYELKEMFWIEGTGFLDVMDIGWNIVPLLMLIIGIICMVLSGSEEKSQGVYQ